MKKKFMCISLVISMICTSFIHAIMEQKTQTDDGLLDEKNRHKKEIILLSELSINEHIVSLVNLYDHCFAKKFDCNYFDYSRQLLKNKIYDSLKEATNQNVSCWHNEIGWFKKLSTLPLKTQNIIENILREVIRPNPKILFDWNSAKNTRWIDYNLDGKKNIILYEDGSGKIINAEHEEVLCERNDIRWMRLNPAGTIAIVRYEDDRGEIINLENYNQDIIFTELKPAELLLIFVLKNLNFPPITGSLAPYYLLWQSFTPHLKQKLKNLYFSKKINTLIQAMGKLQQKI